MGKNLYIDIHALETLAPSCVNRDDLGSPKTAVFGGVTRGRVSSQCWKRAARDYYARVFGEERTGARTKRAAGLVAAEIASIDPSLDAEALAAEALAAAGAAMDKDGQTKALLFISRPQARALAGLAARDPGALAERGKGKTARKKGLKEALQAALNSEPSEDIALFGRMVAGEAALGREAAASVAQAITTHGFRGEIDYFSALDDLGPGSPGAAHIDLSEFGSGTFYRYASVDMRELERAMGEEAPAVARRFAEAFLRSVPAGRRHAYAQFQTPGAVFVALRGDAPVYMANAFERPVEPDPGGGYAKASERALEAYALESYAKMIPEPAKAYVCAMGGGMERLGEPAGLDEMLGRVEEDARALMGRGEET